MLPQGHWAPDQKKRRGTLIAGAAGARGTSEWIPVSLIPTNSLPRIELPALAEARLRERASSFGTLRK